MKDKDVSAAHPNALLKDIQLKMKKDKLLSQLETIQIDIDNMVEEEKTSHEYQTFVNEFDKQALKDMQGIAQKLRRAVKSFKTFAAKP